MMSCSVDKHTRICPTTLASPLELLRYQGHLGLTGPGVGLLLERFSRPGMLRSLEESEGSEELWRVYRRCEGGF